MRVLVAIAVLSMLMSVGSALASEQPGGAPPPLDDLLELRFDGIDGASTTLGDQWIPGRPLVIALWATWCAPCLREMKIFDELARELGPERITIIGINVDRWPEKETAVRTILRNIQPQYPQWRADAPAWRSLTGESLPLRLPRVRIHDREGRLVLYSTRMTFGTPRELRRTIRSLASDGQLLR